MLLLFFMFGAYLMYRDEEARQIKLDNDLYETITR
jgi:hypothetical protein